MNLDFIWMVEYANKTVVRQRIHQLHFLLWTSGTSCYFTRNILVCYG